MGAGAIGEGRRDNCDADGQLSIARRPQAKPGPPHLRGRSRANGFKTFIVSGMRPWAEKVYGVPPEQVISSSIKTRFEMRDGEPTLFRLPQVNFIDDKAGKPAGNNEHIGRRPIAAFGNSDGDLAMLQWTTVAGGLRFGMLVHHTDAEREYAYDRDMEFGRLDNALDAAAVNQWTVVDMKADWKIVLRN